jgi:DNA-binding CsgD family transcriptional regulator
MADRGKKLDECTQKQIKRLATYMPIKATARQLDVSKNTVKKYR